MPPKLLTEITWDAEDESLAGREAGQPRRDCPLPPNSKILVGAVDVTLYDAIALKLGNAIRVIAPN